MSEQGQGMVYVQYTLTETKGYCYHHPHEYGAQYTNVTKKNQAFK